MYYIINTIYYKLYTLYYILYTLYIRRLPSSLQALARANAPLLRLVCAAADVAARHGIRGMAVSAAASVIPEVAAFIARQEAVASGAASATLSTGVATTCFFPFLKATAFPERVVKATSLASSIFPPTNI